MRKVFGKYRKGLEPLIEVLIDSFDSVVVISDHVIGLKRVDDMTYKSNDGRTIVIEGEGDYIILWRGHNGLYVPYVKFGNLEVENLDIIIPNISLAKEMFMNRRIVSGKIAPFRDGIIVFDSDLDEETIKRFLQTSSMPSEKQTNEIARINFEIDVDAKAMTPVAYVVGDKIVWFTIIHDDDVKVQYTIDNMTFEKMKDVIEYINGGTSIDDFEIENGIYMLPFVEKKFGKAYAMKIFGGKVNNTVKSFDADTIEAMVKKLFAGPAVTPIGFRAGDRIYGPLGVATIDAPSKIIFHIVGLNIITPYPKYIIYENGVVNLGNNVPGEFVTITGDTIDVGSTSWRRIGNFVLYKDFFDNYLIDINSGEVMPVEKPIAAEVYVMNRNAFKNAKINKRYFVFTMDGTKIEAKYSCEDGQVRIYGYPESAGESIVLWEVIARKFGIEKVRNIATTSKKYETISVGHAGKDYVIYARALLGDKEIVIDHFPAGYRVWDVRVNGKVVSSGDEGFARQVLFDPTLAT